MHTPDIAQMAHVAELVALRSASLALVLSARAENPDVASLRVTINDDGGVIVVEGEYLDRSGLAVAGFGL